MDALKQRFGATRLTLVGYSGGAAVAALLATRRNDVARLVTVDGNLDHRAWTAHHRVTPLTGSLNPAEKNPRSLKSLNGIFSANETRSCRHFWHRISSDMPSAHVKVIDGYDRKCCWAENWATFWKDIR